MDSKNTYHEIFWLFFAHLFSFNLGNSLCVCSSQSCPTLCDPPWTVAHQAPLSMGFSRQEYWRELPFLSAEDHPNQGSKLCLSPLLCCRQILYLLSLQESHYHDCCLSNYPLVAKTPILGSWLCWLSFQWGQSWEGNVPHSEWRYVT